MPCNLFYYKYNLSHFSSFFNDYRSYVQFISHLLYWGRSLLVRFDKLLSLRKERQKDLYGLCTPSVEGSTTFNYGIGILLDDDTLPCESNEFTVWNVEEGTYVVFDCIGNDGDCISETWAKFYKEFLPQTGYKVSERTDYEVYHENNKDGVFCELFIPIEK